MSNYSQEVLRYFFNLQHVKNLQKDPQKHFVKAGSVAQGALVEIFFNIKNSVIKGAHFLCYGGPALIAACEYICAWLEGKTIDAVLNELNPDLILKALSLSSFYVHVAVKIVMAIMKFLTSSDVKH